MSNAGLDIADVIRLTGLEESQVRFYESVHAALLPPKLLVGAEPRFDPRAVEMLRAIHDYHQAGHDPTDLSAVQHHAMQAAVPAQPPRKRGRMLAVTSGKGGVGKSNISLNLAIALRQEGRRVLLFDADMGTGNLHILAGSTGGMTLLDCVRGNALLREVIQPGPAGIGLVAGGSGILELANLPEAQRRSFVAQLRALAGAVDIVVIDTGTGISDSVVEFACSGDQLLVVTTPDLTAITDGYGIIKAVARIAPNMPVGVVVNNTPSAKMGQQVFERLAQCADRFLHTSLTYIGPVYRDPAVVRAVAARTPFILGAPQGKASRCVRRVANLTWKRWDEIPDAVDHAADLRTRGEATSAPLPTPSTYL